MISWHDSRIDNKSHCQCQKKIKNSIERNIKTRDVSRRLVPLVVLYFTTPFYYAMPHCYSFTVSSNSTPRPMVVAVWIVLQPGIKRPA